MCDHEHILDFFLGGLPINFVVRLDVTGHPVIKILQIKSFYSTLLNSVLKEVYL